METHTETHGVVAPGGTYSEVGTVTFNGNDFSAYGAYVTDLELVAYLGPGEVTIPAKVERWYGRTIHVPAHNGKRGNVQTWNGQIIGRYVITKSWRTPVRGGDWYEMHQVSIVLTDGRHYQGRSQGPQMIVRAKRIAKELK